MPFGIPLGDMAFGMGMGRSGSPLGGGPMGGGPMGGGPMGGGPRGPPSSPPDQPALGMGPPGPPPRPTMGANVTVTGLTKHTDVNGMIGEVVGFDDASGKVKVALPNGTIGKVLPVNLAF